jgi:hypothetical protein
MCRRILGKLSYRLFAKTHNPNTVAVTISMAHAAVAQLHLIKTTPATVTGAIAAAATPARCRRVTLHRREDPIARLLP